MTTSWGKLGTAGQSKDKDFATHADAVKEAEKIAAKKEKVTLEISTPVANIIPESL